MLSAGLVTFEMHFRRLLSPEAGLSDDKLVGRGAGLVPGPRLHLRKTEGATRQPVRTAPDSHTRHL